MKPILMLLVACCCVVTVDAQVRKGDCDSRIKAAFYDSRGGGFLIPEKYYAPSTGSCSGFYGRACGQFLVPYVVLHKALGGASELEATRVNRMLGTSFQPGNYYLMYVNTTAASLRLRCPSRAELRARDSEGDCATNSDCGCNPKFIDGAGRTSGDIVEGFVEGLNRAGGYCSAVRKITLR